MGKWIDCHCGSAWDNRFVLQCNGCSAWIHGDCANIKEEDAGLYDKFYCSLCVDIFGPSVLRPPPPLRPTRETRTLIDYNEMHNGGAEDERKYTKLLATKRFVPSKFQHFRGEDVTIEYLRKTGMPEPIIIDDPDGLEMRMPPSNLTVSQVADACGRDKIVEAMEVSTQNEKQMTLHEWAEYFATPEEKRKRLFNVISLEISQSMLNAQIVRPRIVRELDWIDNVWPPRTDVPEFPRVQLYCLMSVKDCYTDFHIDFGGSSVFYHILSGQKVFYFIRPTPVNLKKYEKWSSSPDQNRIFFGDEVKECIEVHLTAGNTMIIPAGWIHAVYTPSDSVVIGGNFLQGLRMDVQLEVYNIENKSGVPPKFRFPFFVRMQWYAAKKYLQLLRSDPEQLSSHELSGLTHLIDFLSFEIRKLTEPGLVDKAEFRLARANVPTNLKNIQRLVLSLKCAVARARVLKGAAAEAEDLDHSVKQLPPQEEWDSQQSEHEYDDSDNESDDATDDEEAASIKDEQDEDGDGDSLEKEDFVPEEQEAAEDEFDLDVEGRPVVSLSKSSRSARPVKKKRYRGVDGFVDDSGDVDYGASSSRKRAKKGKSSSNKSTANNNYPNDRTFSKSMYSSDQQRQQESRHQQNNQSLAASNGITYHPVAQPFQHQVYNHNTQTYIPMFPSAASTSNTAALLVAASNNNGKQPASSSSGPSQGFSLKQGMIGPETTYVVAPKASVTVPPAMLRAGGSGGNEKTGAGVGKKKPDVFARLAKKIGMKHR